MDNRMAEAQKIIEEMQNKFDIQKIEHMIKDNKIEFVHKDKEYRVRLLNLREKEELSLLRRKEFGRLLKDKDILMEKDLIAQYKERGLDVTEIDVAVDKIQTEKRDICMRLGEAIAKNAAENILKSYQERVNDVDLRLQTAVAQKILLLEYSLENQLLDFVYKCLTYLSIEEKIEEKWQRAFKTFDAFLDYSDEELILKAGKYTSLLQNVY